ncbi:RNA polymerase sigma factor RpoH [Vibrio paucivorans]
MSTSAAAMSLQSSESLSHYMKFVNSHSILKEWEEKDIAENLYYNNDESMVAKLVLPHLRYVVFIARGFAGYGLPLTDMIQCGNIGLLKAVRKFDPTLGYRLVTFAVHWIKSEITDYILKNWSIVKIATTKAQKKLFFNLKKYKRSQGWMGDSEAADLAEKLDVSKRDVISMDGRLSARDSYINTQSSENDEYCPSLVSVVPEPQTNIALEYEQQDWEQHLNSELMAGLSKLNSRSKDIIFHRWLAEEKLTLTELAHKHGISAERVRQLEAMALDKLKNILKHIHP